MVNGSAARVPLPDEPEWDFVDGDFIDAGVSVGAELPDAEVAPGDTRTATGKGT